MSDSELWESELQTRITHALAEYVDAKIEKFRNEPLIDANPAQWSYFVARTVAPLIFMAVERTLFDCGEHEPSMLPVFAKHLETLAELPTVRRGE